MAGSSRQPDRLANQYIMLPNGMKRPMKLLEQVLRELRDGVEPGEAVEPNTRVRSARVNVYAAMRSVADDSHAPRACG